MTATSRFVSVPSHAVAHRLTEALRADPSCATCNIVEAPHVLNSRGVRGPAPEWASTSDRCRAFGLTPSEVESLEAVLTAPAAHRALVRRVIELSIADAPFIVVWPRDLGDAIDAHGVVDRVALMFDRPVSSVQWSSVAAAIASMRARPLVRPSPDRLAKRLDRALLTATLGRGGAVHEEWRDWRARVDFDDSAFALGQIGPMLFDNLQRAGVEDGVMGRLSGLNRRAWYVNQLARSTTAKAVAQLQQAGIDPLVLGDLASATTDTPEGAVRPVRKVEIAVALAELDRAFEVLSRDGWSSPRGTPGSVMVERSNSMALRRAPHDVIHLHWRSWPARSEALLAPDRDGGRVVLHDDVSARVQSPTRRLLRLWARSSDPEPGHQLRTICDTADVFERSSGDIDLDQLWAEGGRLGLVDYGKWYLDAAGVGTG